MHKTIVMEFTGESLEAMTDLVLPNQHPKDDAHYHEPWSGNSTKIIDDRVIFPFGKLLPKSDEDIILTRVNA